MSNRILLGHLMMAHVDEGLQLCGFDKEREDRTHKSKNMLPEREGSALLGSEACVTFRTYKMFRSLALGGTYTW